MRINAIRSYISSISINYPNEIGECTIRKFYQGPKLELQFPKRNNENLPLGNHFRTAPLVSNTDKHYFATPDNPQPF